MVRSRNRRSTTRFMDIFLARQPIFDRERRVFGYELLFRSGPENYFSAPNVTMPSAQVISSGMLGIGELTDGKRAFMNFSRDSLVSDLAFALPPGEVVIELLESVTPDGEVLEACERLRKGGYRIALDDYEDRPDLQPLLELADFVKVDVLSTDVGERAGLAARLAATGVNMLAEKVETWDVFGQTASEGYRYFQGYFFSRPVMLAAKAIPGFRLNYLRLLEELNAERTSIDRLEDLVKREASIAYRLLRRVNSAAYGFRTEVRSLRHALVLLGEREVRTCATVWSMAELGRNAPAELVVASTLRARVCELLAGPAGRAEESGDLFLMGLFSMLDAILGLPMDQASALLPVTRDVRDALLEVDNGLRRVLECVIAYEQGAWDAAETRALAAGVTAERLAASYLEGLAWVREIFAGSLSGRSD